jgi:hypothetical protein
MPPEPESPKQTRRPSGARQRSSLAECAGRVEHDVDAASLRHALHAFFEVFGPVVDTVRDAHLLQACFDADAVPSPRRRRTAELDRCHADAAGGRVHEHALALLHVASSAA